MPTLGDVRREASAMMAAGQLLPALQRYDAIVASAPLAFTARMKIGDCLAALGQTELAAQVYRAVAFYCLQAGHPLAAIVAARVVTEQLGGQADDILARLVVQYGSESELIGKFAARLGVPRAATEIAVPTSSAADPIAAAAERAIHATDDFEGFPEVLHPIPLLSAMSEEALRRVLSTFIVRRLPAGAPVIREGAPGTSFFFLAEGSVSVFDTDSMGQTRELAKLGEGAIFGEMALLSAKPRSASVSAVTECDLLEATRESLAALAGELPAVATALQKFTYDRLLQNLMLRNPLFKPFSKTQQRDLLGRFTSHDVATGTDIIHQGDPGTGLFVVLSGEVEVKRDNDGRTTPLATLRAGEVFGEMALLKPITTTATVTAAQPSTVLFLSRDYVDRMVANIPQVRAYLSALAEDRELDTQLAMQIDHEGDEDEEDGDSIVILF